MSDLTPPQAPEDKRSSSPRATEPTRCTQTAKATGFFTAIDGPSGVGKTTVTALTAKLLAARDVAVLATRQPSDSPLGLLARSSTHDLQGLPLTYLMAADRHYHYARVIRPAVDAGKVVVCDRYVATALVLDQIDGADPGFIWSLYRSHGWPDLAVILSGDAPVSHARAQRRGSYSRFHEGGLAAAETEASLYADAAARLAHLGYPVKVIPVNDHDPSEIAAQVATLISSRMNDVRTAPPGRTTRQ